MGMQENGKQLLIFHDREAHRERLVGWSQQLGISVLAPTPHTMGEAETQQNIWKQVEDLGGDEEVLGVVVHANYAANEMAPAGSDEKDLGLAPGHAVRAVLGLPVQVAKVSLWRADMLSMQELSVKLSSCPVFVVTGGQADASSWEELNLPKQQRLRWLSLLTLERCSSWKAVETLPAWGELPSLEQLIHDLKKILRRMLRKLNDLEESGDVVVLDQLFRQLQGDHRKPPLANVLSAMSSILSHKLKGPLLSAAEEFVHQQGNQESLSNLRHAAHQVFEELQKHG